jgi:dethiobiotin synthetase
MTGSDGGGFDPIPLAAIKTNQSVGSGQKTAPSARGLLVLGTEFGCGKTTGLAGLSATMREQGFTARAIKPVSSGSVIEREAEQSFIGTITRTPRTQIPLVLDRQAGLKEHEWQQAVLHARPGETTFTMIELPGGVATPMRFLRPSERSRGISWRDTTDFASEFGLPCLLVARHAFDALEKLRLASSYLKAKGLSVVGLITVETTLDGGRELELNMSREQVELALLEATGCPYLGCIKYSPSISVPTVNQGNLIKMTSGGVELLGLFKSLNLKLSI